MSLLDALWALAQGLAAGAALGAAPAVLFLLLITPRRPPEASNSPADGAESRCSFRRASAPAPHRRGGGVTPGRHRLVPRHAAWSGAA